MIGLIVAVCAVSGCIGCSIGVVLMCLVSINKEGKQCTKECLEREYGI